MAGRNGDSTHRRLMSLIAVMIAAVRLSVYEEKDRREHPVVELDGDAR